MSDCIFCKIANGEIPSATIHEDEDFRVILDVAPASKGHILILPKAHFANLYEMPEEQVKEAFGLAKRVATRMKKSLACDGLNILQNNEVAAGQTVFHFHIHLIPRYEDDNVQIKWSAGSLTQEDQATICDAVQLAGQSSQLN